MTKSKQDINQENKKLDILRFLTLEGFWYWSEEGNLISGQCKNGHTFLLSNKDLKLFIRDRKHFTVEVLEFSLQDCLDSFNKLRDLIRCKELKQVFSLAPGTITINKPFDFSSVRQKYVDNMIDLDKAKHYAISKEHGKLADTLSNLNKQDLESFCEWLFIQIK